jgi:hypothetical protein
LKIDGGMMETKEVSELTLASEEVLKKDWLSPEEDVAWADL